MLDLYLTPASISFLTQFILALAISVFLASRLRQGGRPLALLTAFFASVTLFIGLLFLDAALSPFPRLLAVYAENTILALALVLLIQFAYRFPQFYPHHKWEAYAGLAASLAYLAWEGQFALYRYLSLLQHDTVYYRPLVSAYANAVILLWVPIAFLRQAAAADPRPVNGLLKLLKPHGKEAWGARAFAFIFGLLFVLGVINVLREFPFVSTTFYNMAMSIGILTALWLFASNYVHFIPGGASILAKLSILSLTLFLALLGSVGWMIAPPYITTYRPDLADHQTLRFSPDSSGGYAVSQVAFHFETELGDRVHVRPTNELCNHKIDFSFPFYGQIYTELYAAGPGVISMGQAFWQPNLQAGRANVPVIFPLMIDLNTEAGGGLYARVEEDRLVLTWDHLPALYRPEAIFTFQAILYQDGVFDISYNGLPLPFVFDPDDTPSANPWIRGAIPGRGENLHAGQDRLPEPLTDGQWAIIENYQLDFRRYLHRFILPLGGVVIGGSLLLLLALPILLHLAIVRPLESLLAGVRHMEAGRFVQVEVKSQDEIGFLAQAFNTMSSRLDELVTKLETRVAERTLELTKAVAESRQLNEQLGEEIAERERWIAELKAFSHTVAHDLKNPLNMVIGYSQLLLEDLSKRNETGLVEFARSIDQMGSKMVRIIDELLILSSVHQKEIVLSPLDMPAILREVEASLVQTIRQYQAEIIKPPESAWPVALGHAPWVEEVWANYISNAIKYGGTPPRIELGADLSGEDKHVRFWIRDNGDGLSPEAQARLFTEFARLDETRATGHGLGLSIVKRIVEKLGGQVGVESTPRQGSTFFFTLAAAAPIPLEQDALAPPQAQESTPELAKSLAAISPDVLVALRQAAIVGDLTEIFHLVEQISEQDAVLGKILDKLAHDFKHQAIVELIQQA
jgi:signal transduction histidine kinase